MSARYFTQDTFGFLAALAANNRRDWFEDHKADYEAHVRAPALEFIGDIAPDLARISPHFLAVARKAGGSLMRVNRDVRFGHDKRPYKTNIGIQFRHEAGKDVHAPGFYLHVEPGECFVGVGIRRPDRTALGALRDRIVERPDDWIAARDDRDFVRTFTLEGDALMQAPRGYPRDHPLIADLKRKDFIAVAPVSDAVVRGPRFYSTVVDAYARSTPFMRFSCRALGVAF